MESPPRNPHKSPFTLLSQRRFAPFFFTQFLGAFNDNAFKNTLALLVTYHAAFQITNNISALNNLAALLFILPFFIFSATAGQLADKYDKATLIQSLKLSEILIMCLASIGFYLESTHLLLFILFMMGAQSSFFGPVKYSIIPQHLPKEELVGGNALVEGGTFLAILFGTIVSGLLVANFWSPASTAALLVLVAAFGWLSSKAIPSAQPADPTIRVNFNPITQTIKTIRYARETKSIFLCVLGISWFWFLGAAYLSQLPVYVKTVINGGASIVTVLLTSFSIGIGIGSLLCEKLSGGKVELGLVPLGSIGISIFGIDLALVPGFTSVFAGPLSISEFLGHSQAWRILIDLSLIGVFGGFYIVPLYAFVQSRSKPEIRSRIIAANNILNALLMVVSSITSILLLTVFELTIPTFFLIIAILNIIAAIIIYTVLPEFVIRFLIWLLTHSIYRVKHHNLDSIPDQGAAVLICNHVSYVDALIMGGAIRRPVRFVMYKPIFDIPILNSIFRIGKTIPITSKNKDASTYAEAFNRISSELKKGELVCIFPEGQLTTDGEIAEFKNGIEKIIARDNVPIIPLALRGLWGSWFSHRNGRALTRWPTRFWSRVELVAGNPISPTNVSLPHLRNQVAALRGDWK